MAMNGKITLVSHKGNGSTREVTVAIGMTVREVLFAELDITDPDKLVVVVDGQALPQKEWATATLRDGAFVIIVPKDTKGN